MTGVVRIRREPRPGDPAAIVELHRRVYPPEYGVDPSFVGFVQASVDAAVEHGWPGEREGIWVAELDGEFAGCIGYTDEGDGVAMLRWFVFDRALRGRGLGRRLVAELLAEVASMGYSLVRLETFSDLRAAAHLYREHRFEVVSADTGPRWGREEITYQRYELPLARGGSAVGAAHAAAHPA